MGLFGARGDESLAAKRKRYSNMRFIIGVATAYILYDGIKLIRSQETTPTFFYVYLVVFTIFMIIAFFFNLNRLKAVTKEIEEEQAKQAASEATTVGGDQPEKADWPDDLSQS